MISDPNELEEIRKSWKGVEALRQRLKAATAGAVSSSRLLGGGSFAIVIAEIAHNLPFIQACAVLNDVLYQLAVEDKFFHCRNKGRRVPLKLGTLLKESKDQLPWNNFTLICEAKECRNDVAHKGKTFPRGKCWEYVDAIKDQLTKWNVL